MIKKADEEEEFLRPSNIPEAIMLKQERKTKSAVIESPMSVSMIYSSSSTISIQSVLFAVVLSLSMIFS